MGGFASGFGEIGATALISEVVIQVKDEATEGLTKLVADLRVVEDSALSMQARMSAGATAIADVGIALGLATLGVVAWSTSAASAFQHSTQALQSFVGVSSRDLAYYRDGLINLSLETGGSLDELSTNLGKVVQAQYFMKDALQITQVAQEAAIASHEQATTTLTPLLAVMRAYNLQASESATVMDALLVASRDSGSAFGAFTQSMSRTLTTSVALGISYQDLLAVTASLSQGQVTMYRSGMLVNQLLSRLQATLRDANPTARTFGITMADLAEHGKTGLVPTLKFIDEQIHAHMDSYKTAAQRVAAYKDAVQEVLGTGPASQAFLRLEADGWKRLTDEQKRVVESQGTTARSFKSAEQTYGDSLEAMEHRMNTLGVAIGTGLLPVLTALEQDISNIITPIAKFAYEHQHLTEAVVAGVAIFTALAVGLRVALGLHDLLARATAVVTGSQTEEAAALVRTGVAADGMAVSQAAATTAMGLAAAAADAEVVSLTALYLIQEALQKQGGGMPSSPLPSRSTTIAEEAKAYGPQVVEDAALPTAAATAAKAGSKAAPLVPVAEEASAIAPEIAAAGSAAAAAAPEVTGFAVGLGTIASFAVGIGEVAAVLVTLDKSGAIPHMKQDANDLSTGMFNFLDGIDKRTPIVGGFAGAMVHTANVMGDWGNAVDVLTHQADANTASTNKQFDAKGRYNTLVSLGVQADLANLLVSRQMLDFQGKGASALALSTDKQIAYTKAIDDGKSPAEAMQARIDVTNASLERQATAQQHVTDALKATTKEYNQAAHAMLLVAEAQADMERSHDKLTRSMEQKTARVVDQGFTLPDGTKNPGFQFQKKETAATSFDLGGGPALEKFRSIVEGLPPAMASSMDISFKAFNQSQRDLHHTYLTGVTDLTQQRKTANADAQRKFEVTMDGASKKNVERVRAQAEATLTATEIANNNTWKNGVAGLHKTFDEAIDKLRHGLRVDSSGAAFGKQIEQDIPQKAADTMAALVGQIALGTTALAPYIQSVRTADAAQEQLTQTLIKADKLTGHWADALTKLTGDVDKKLGDAMGHLTIDLHDHSGNIKADTAAAIHQQIERNKWTDAQTAATQRVTLATGDFAAKQSVVQAQSTTAMGKLAEAFLSGKGNIDQLGKRAAEAAEKVLKYTEAMAHAQVKSGDFSTAQTGAQTLSTIATGRVSQSERLGTGNLPELIEAARKAAAVVDTFTVASAKAALAVGDFAQQTSAAQTLSTIALNKYAEAIYKGSAGIGVLEKAALGAAETVFHMTEAQRIAAMHVAENVGSPASKLSARTAEAQGNLNDALATGAEQVRLHGHMTSEASLAIGAAREELYKFSNAAAKAAASGPPTDFTSGQAAAQARLTLSTNDLETAIMRGSGGIKELEAAVTQAASDVKNYAKIHRQELLDVARATGDYTAVVAEKAQDLKTKSDIATAALEHAVNTGAGDLGRLAAAAARAAKFLDQHGQRSLESSILVDKAGHQWATAWEDQAKYLASGEMKRAVNIAAQDIQKHGKVGRDAADQLARAYEAQEVISMKQTTLRDAEDQALLTAALTLGDFTAAVAQATKIAKTLWDTADAGVQSAVLNPTFRPKIPETPTMRQSQGTRIAEGLPSDLPVAPTAMAAALAQLPAAADAMAQTAFKSSEAARIELPYRIEAAKKLGDWGQAVALSAELTASTAKRGSDAATAYFLGLGGSLSAAKELITAGAEANETQLLAQAASSKLVAQADIDAAVKAGDLGRAFDLLGAQLAKNLTTDKSNIAGDIQYGRDPSKDLEQYRQDKAAQDGYNQSLITTSILIGEFGAAVSGISSKLSTDLGNATGALTLSLYQTGTASAADIATAQRAREATERFAQAQWDASYATASASEKTKMLDQRFSELVSRNSTIQGAQASVDNAKMAEVAAEGAVTNSLMAEQVTATNGIASILSAQTSLLSAISASQVSAIDDQTSVMQAEATLVSNQMQQQVTMIGALGTASREDWVLLEQIGRDQLQVDRDAVEIAKTTAAMDRATNGAAVKLAQDQLTLTQDKAAGDNQAAADATRLAMDHLAEARIQTRIALDSQKLALDQLSTLTIVASAFTDVNDFGTMITEDLNRLNADQRDMLHAQQQTAADQQQSSADAAAAAFVQAQDNLLIGQDNASAAALKDSYSLQLAELKQKQESDNEQKQRDEDHLKVLQAIEANTQTSAKAGEAAAKAAVELLQQEVLRKRIGLDRSTVANTGELDYLNGWSSGAYANGGLPSA